MTGSRKKRLLAWFGIPAVMLIALVALWDWDWFIPLVERQASSALGRPVTLSHLHIRLGPTVQVVADDVVINNPPGWSDKDPPLATIHALTVKADLLGYITGRGLILPLIGLDAPKLFVAETKDGDANFHMASSGKSSNGSSSSPSVKIGDLQISDGAAHIVMPKLKTDFNTQIASEGQGNDARITVDANGTYAAQPITGRLVGGALLSLRDAAHPWPVDLSLANGPTKVAVNGTLRDPLAFKGADVRFRFAGPDMGLLEPLLGFPIPKTPAYQIAGRVGLDGFNKIRLEDFQGRLGNSDIAGTVQEEPSAAELNGKAKPVVTMDLRSNRIDLADLSGFIGGTPGRANTPGATQQQKQEVAKADASSKLLPETPISIPRLQWADIHLKYRGAHIEGKNMPLDNLSVALDVVDGHIAVHPLSFGVGKGRLITNLDLTPQSDKNVRAKVDLKMQNLDVSRMMAATKTFQGAGSVSGVGAVDATGNSLASLLANGNGQMKMAMAGGNLSAVLIDLTGLQFGNALLSAMGVPSQTPVQCFVGDLGLKQGVLDFTALTLDTGEAITNVGGNVNLSKETIDLALKTDSKHFSVGSLPTRIAIGGTFKNPSIRPGAEVAARAGAAAGLAALFLPLAVLPTVQFGTSDADDARCGELLQQARAKAGGKAALPTQENADATR